MKFLHLSDLHLGKKVNEISMLENQKHILKQIISIIEKENIDCVLIAGDVYDKTVPSTEAVRLFDDFLSEMSQRSIKAIVISGNHDSAERIAFGGRLMNKSGVNMSPVYNGDGASVCLSDEFGEIYVYMLPFIKPSNVRAFYEDEISSYTDALSVAINKMNIDTSKRNIIVTHQFVTGASRTDSEEISVGGTDNVSASVFEGFDYTALGHIHRAQSCGKDTIRYCGTPLKYSFSEAKDKKTATLFEIKEKGNYSISEIPLIPLHDMHEIKGTYEELTLKSFYENTSYRGDYLHITLTDEEDIPEAMGKLRAIYHNLMKLDYDNTRTRTQNIIENSQDSEHKSPEEFFVEFYTLQNGQAPTEEQMTLINKLIEKIGEDVL